MQYPRIIELNPKMKAIADLGLRLERLKMPLTDLPELLDENILDDLAIKYDLKPVDGYLPGGNKIELIKQAIAIHRIKGTKRAMLMLLNRLGFSKATIQEGLGNNFYNSQINYDGVYFYGDKAKWSYYAVYLNQSATAVEIELIKELLPFTAPARCILHHIYTD